MLSILPDSNSSGIKPGPIHYDQVATTKQIYIGYIGEHLTSGSTTKIRR